MIYFDNAATSGKKPQTVIEGVNFALRSFSANPGRSGHRLSQNAAIAMYKTREELANFFGAEGAENVIFTANCTTSINYVLKGVLTKNDHIVISDMEHNAVMRPISKMGVKYSMAKVSLTDSEETVENFKKCIRNDTKMVFCTAASNVFGVALPLEKIGAICRERNILFGVDGAQGAGVLKIDMKKMNIDFLCLAPHKGLYAPMGLGVLISQKAIKTTLIEGGTGTDSINFIQPSEKPEMFESGTQNLPGIIGCQKGIQFVKSRFDEIYNHEMNLVYKFFDGLLKIDGVLLYNNPREGMYAPVLSFNIKNITSDEFALQLSDMGFALRAGLHCAPTAHKKMGTLNGGTIRFSPSFFNSQDEVIKLLNCIKKSQKR